MQVTVISVRIPASSTIGYGNGLALDGAEVQFVGDHRSMRHIGEVLVAGEEVNVTLEDWQITHIGAAPSAEPVA